MNWTYDPRLHRFRDARGNLVSMRDLITTRDRFVAAREAMAQALGESFASGAISLDDFEAQFRALTAETITAMQMFGAGGEAMLRQKPVHIARLVELLTRQIPYADAFLSELRAGEVSPEAAGARAAMYQAAGINAYEVAQSDDWGISLPYYPADGDTECHSNCRCSWEITTNWDEAQQRDVTYARWQTEGDDKVCDGCQGRADAWPGNVIA